MTHSHNHNHSHARGHNPGHGRGHGHAHHQQSGDNHGGATKNIATAFGLNFGFAIIELVGGLATNSVSILSDALHDLGDSVSLAVAWVLQKRSGKRRDAKFSYGYKRFSLMSSVFLSGVLLVSSIFIVIEAVERLGNPQEVHARGMLGLAVLGIAVNGFAALRLEKGTSLSERAVWLHLVEDVLGWVAVLVVSVVMMIVDHPFTRLLDPILSLGIAGWVLWNVWRNLRDTFRILLQGVPLEIDTKELTDDILAVPEVGSLHDLHVWSQDGESHVMTLHVVLSAGLSGERAAELSSDTQRLKGQIRDIGRRHNIDHTTVEIELADELDCEYLACK